MKQVWDIVLRYRLAEPLLGATESDEKPEHRYDVILYWSGADQVLIGEVPELPGCVADGPTYAAAREAIAGVIAAWIATARDLGRPILKGRLLFA